MNYYLKCLKNYAVFEGRARRKEYWMFVLINLLIEIAIEIADELLGPGGATAILSWVYWLAILLPSLAVTIRRLHDTGRCGWWLLLGFIPIIGQIPLLIFLCGASRKGENKYGPNPCGDAAGGLVPSMAKCDAEC